MGGLAPDSNDPMSEEMQHYLQMTWRQIQTTIPGTEFNFDYWRLNTPRRSTYPACRAVLSARAQAAELEDAMLEGIQRAYYLEAKNPSDTPVLIDIAKAIGCNVAQFTQDLTSPTINRLLQNEMHRARELGATGFPSLIHVADNSTHRLLDIHYGNHQYILEQIESLNVA
jgi:putative protein-disulfide isomerase